MSVSAQWELRFGTMVVKHTKAFDLQFLIGFDHFNTDRTSIGVDLVIDPPGVQIEHKGIRLPGSALEFELDQRFYGIQYRAAYFFNDHDNQYSTYLSSVLGVGIMDQHYISDYGGTSYRNASTPLVTLGLRWGLRGATIITNHVYIGGGLNVVGRSNLPGSVSHAERISTFYGELGYIFGATW